MKYVLIAVLLSLGLTSCGTKYIYVPKPVSVLIPNAFLELCERASPPDIDVYLSATSEVREGLLIDTLSLQYKYLDECDARLFEGKKWKEKQQQLIKDLAIKAEHDAKEK